MCSILAKAGAPNDPSQIGVSRSRIREMIDIVQLMRARINIFDLAKRACCYDSLVDSVFAEGHPLDLGKDRIS